MNSSNRETDMSLDMLIDYLVKETISVQHSLIYLDEVCILQGFKSHDADVFFMRSAMYKYVEKKKEFYRVNLKHLPEYLLVHLCKSMEITSKALLERHLSKIKT